MTQKISLQKRKTLASIRPYLADLMDILDQLAQREDPCEGKSERRKCLIAYAKGYGVDLSELMNSQMTDDQILWVVQAVDTVGRQILACIENANALIEIPLPPIDETVEGFRPTQTATETLYIATPQAAFEAVFKDVIFQYNATDTRDIDTSTSGPFEEGGTITIKLSKDVFIFCQAKKVEVLPDGTEKPAQSDPACDEEFTRGVDENNNPIKYRYVRTPYATLNTPQGIIRHEIGHGFFNILENVLEEPVRDIYRSEIGDDEDAVAQNLRDKLTDIASRYFFNTLPENRSGVDEEEGFADIFSVWGRFLNEDGFDSEEHAERVMDTDQYRFFDRHFCCWVGQILNRTDFCK